MRPISEVASHRHAKGIPLLGVATAQLLDTTTTPSVSAYKGWLRPFFGSF